MGTVVRARVEHGVLIPEQPLPLAEGEIVEIEIRPLSEHMLDESWEARWQRFLARARTGLDIPDGTIDREHLYPE
ncbi:MAG: antitoxin family protein [Armatimonadota bacterium]|nr:antitoxin family protein [bacterium]MDW8320293.1 antitoxin family protein [Armatimonadota bacterium]